MSWRDRSSPRQGWTMLLNHLLGVPVRFRDFVALFLSWHLIFTSVVRTLNDCNAAIYLHLIYFVLSPQATLFENNMTLKQYTRTHTRV